MKPNRSIAPTYGSHALPKARDIIVTGGAGFLGSHLCARLIADGHFVTSIDNLATGSLTNIEKLLGSPRFSFIRHDVIHPFDHDNKIDEVFNLACPASPLAYQADPLQTLKTSFLGALYSLDFAERHGAKILQASTSEVYGDPTQHPQTETYWGNVNPIGPRACYDEGKRSAEALFFDSHRIRKTRIRVARIFNTYGPHMTPTDGRVISNFVVQALLNKDITIYGTGYQTRSFCYVDDLVEGLIRLMGASDSVTGPINLGNPTEITIVELALLIIRLTGSRSKAIHLPGSVDDPALRRPDIGRAIQTLRWEPKISLEQGLAKTIAYFDELLTKSNCLAKTPV